MNEERERLAGPRQEIPLLAQLLHRLKLCHEEFAEWPPEYARKSAKEFRFRSFAPKF